MLEGAHDLLSTITLEDVPVDELTSKTLATEDRPEPESVTDPAAITAILGL